ncbi:hypothetical protein Rhsp01_44330 [Rhizobium sp. NBRC 114257]|uniref:Uncharacterized protein n=1 Tax=Rhizobium dioscoreae TaxID=2653122 RepID=A0ABQ0Z908_9HYPH|nr:hypothetical protein RsS93_46390 [Rhizobium dioscoreae]GLU83257.1 hypothetical protein Rhsp01_44330 [Rhizobium sp. NBRC 114257]
MPVSHGGGPDRHEIAETIMCEHETAGMLAEMAWSAHQLLGQLQGQGKPAILWIEIELT